MRKRNFFPQNRGYTLADLIGYRFEYLIQNKYPFLTWNNRGSNLSDFSYKDFHLEAKGQCVKYGGRIKPDQVNTFRDLDKPVFYIYGWHSQTGLTKMKKSLVTTMVAQLQFWDLCLVDNALIEKFFAQEQRFAKKQKENGDNHYCVIKPRHFRQIASNALIKRGGEMVNAHDFYGLNPSEWVFNEQNGIKILVRKNRVSLIGCLI